MKNEWKKTLYVCKVDTITKGKLSIEQYFSACSRLSEFLCLFAIKPQLSMIFIFSHFLPYVELKIHILYTFYIIPRIFFSYFSNIFSIFSYSDVLLIWKISFLHILFGKVSFFELSSSSSLFCSISPNFAFEQKKKINSKQI